MGRGGWLRDLQVTRYLVPLMFGLAGIAVLVWLGSWQMQRLAWKEGVLAQIDARIAADPVAIPDMPNFDEHRYLAVQATGVLGEAQLRVLVSQKQIGAGYRMISPLDLGDRTVMLDRGFIKVEADWPTPPKGPVTVVGNLIWPDDRGSATPENDIAGNLWFARDLAPMAAELGTDPVMIVLRQMTPADRAVDPLPVDSAAIPNDHLEYAITWFSLAAIWAVMTGYFIWRQARPTKDAMT